MTDTPDLREQMVEAIKGVTWRFDEKPASLDRIVDAVMGVLPQGFDRFVKTIELLRDRLADTTRERDAAKEELREESIWREDLMHDMAGLDPERPMANTARRYRKERDEAREEVERLRDGWREADQYHAKTGELLLWLHAEAVWRLDVERARHVETVADKDHAWAMCKEVEKAARVAVDSERDAVLLLSWLHAEKVWQLDDTGASRRDWAAEAMRLDVEAEFDPPLATEDQFADVVADILAEFGNSNAFMTEQVTEKLFEFYMIYPKSPIRVESDRGMG